MMNLPLIRFASAISVLGAALLLGASCSAAPNPQPVENLPAAVSADGRPLFQLSEDELIAVFRNVQVYYSNAYPPVTEVFRDGGRYCAAGDWWHEGRFWVTDGELCARVEEQTGKTLCRRFGRSLDGAVYEISGSRGTVSSPHKYDLKPIADGVCQ